MIAISLQGWPRDWHSLLFLPICLEKEDHTIVLIFRFGNLVIVRSLSQTRNPVISTLSHTSTGHCIHRTMTISVPALTRVTRSSGNRRHPRSDRSQVRTGVKTRSLRKGDAFVFVSEAGTKVTRCGVVREHALMEASAPQECCTCDVSESRNKLCSSAGLPEPELTQKEQGAGSDMT